MFVIFGVLLDKVFMFDNVGLELVLVIYFNDLFVIEMVMFKLFIDGEFVVGVEVEVVCGGMCYRND